MTDALRQEVDVHGYAFIPAYRPELETIEAVSLIGSVLSLEGFSVVQELRPRSASSAPPNTYSGNFGMGEFPMHTDLAHWALPPRYLALRCIEGSPEVATGIFDGKVLIEEFGVTLLRRTLLQPRRPLRNGKQLLRLLDFEELLEAPILRWDNIFLKPATDGSEQTYSQVYQYVNSVISNNVYLMAVGDTLVVDNWRMIHRRSPVPPSAENRHINRVYLGGIN